MGEGWIPLDFVNNQLEECAKTYGMDSMAVKYHDSLKSEVSKRTEVNKIAHDRSSCR